MQRRLAELNTEVAERAGSDLAMRIGINTGEVLAHSIEEGIVTGEAVNIAARLQSLADRVASSSANAPTGTRARCSRSPIWVRCR